MSKQQTVNSRQPIRFDGRQPNERIPAAVFPRGLYGCLLFAVCCLLVTIHL